MTQILSPPTTTGPTCTSVPAGLLSRATIRNAVSYAPPDTIVDVTLRVEGEQALVRVGDCGPGVPEDALERIFDAFYRVGHGRDRQSGGAGLGLAIAERAARSVGGSVSAVNRPGGGLQVEMRLPLARPGEC